MKTQLEGLMAEHSIWHSRAKLGGYAPSEEERQSRPPAQHPWFAGIRGPIVTRCTSPRTPPHRRLAGRGRPRTAGGA